MGNIIRPNWTTSVNLPPERVLQVAIDANLDTVLVVGKDQNGRLYLAASSGDGGEIQLLLHRGQQYLVHHIAKQFGDPL